MFLATCYKLADEEAQEDSPNIYHITMTFLRDEETKILFKDRNNLVFSFLVILYIISFMLLFQYEKSMDAKFLAENKM